MIETYLSPGDIMQMYDDEKMDLSACIDELTDHILGNNKYDFMDLYETKKKIESLNEAFSKNHITAKEYLTDLYQLYSRKLN
jgi:hypothetical protein